MGLRCNGSSVVQCPCPTQIGRVVEMWTNPLPTGGLVRTLSDVTERRQAETELRRTKTQAEQATTAKSRFLTSMSHELRTPFNAIIGITEMLHEDAEHDDNQQSEEPLAHVRNAGKHLLLSNASSLRRRVSSSCKPIDWRPMRVLLSASMSLTREWELNCSG